MANVKIERHARGIGANTWRCGGLVKLTVDDIVADLGDPDSHGDPKGTKHGEWHFRLDGRPCAIWDWHGQWSFWGDSEAMGRLFGREHVVS
jgi:hypothetical protein